MSQNSSYPKQAFLQAYINLFVLLSFGFLSLKPVVVFGFFNKSCSSFSKKYFKKLSKPQARLSLKQENFLMEKMDACSNEELGPIVPLLLKNYSRQGLVLKLKRLEKKTAELAYYKWGDFEKALKYYTRLLERPLEPGERFLFQYQIARSFLKLEKNSQALIEAEKSFFKGISNQEKKKALLLKLEILISQKNFSPAEKLIKESLKDLPEDQDFLRESLAVIYESENRLSLAVEELKQIQKPSSFIEVKIKRLEERLENQP